MSDAKKLQPIQWHRVGTPVINKKKSVLFRGSPLTQSGYGTHARMIARYLLDHQDIDLSIQALSWGQTPWYLNPNQLDGLVGRIMECCKGTEKISGFDLSVQLQLPNEWDPGVARVNVGITAGVETDRCNPEWIRCINRMDLVIVPSQHVKQTFENTGHCRTPIKVIPESYPDCFREVDVERLDIDLESKFNFLVVGQFTAADPKLDRKRLQDMLVWLCEAFDGDPDVGIVLKTNMGQNGKIDRKMCIDLLNNKLPKRKEGSPKVHLVHGLMTEHEMLGLYRHPRVKAFVTATRGEGFGLPILEAAVAGLPVVATDWSGHLDFMNEGRFIRLQHDLGQISDGRVDKNIFMKGTHWAEVRGDDFKKKVRKLRSSHSKPREWADELSAKLLKSHSHDALVPMYDDAIGALL